MNAHTPGPWKHRIATGTADREIRSDVAKRGVCVIPFRYGTVESRAADMALILAAPDLLAALTEALRVLNDDSDATPRATAREMARAAIAKARGGK